MTLPFVRNSPALKASADIDGDEPADRVLEMVMQAITAREFSV